MFAAQGVTERDCYAAWAASDRARAASARLMMFLAMPCSRVSGYCSKKLSVTVTSSNQRACDFSSPVRWFNAAKSCALRWQPEPAKTSAESSANSPVQGQPGVKSLGSFTSNAGAELKASASLIALLGSQ
jgi:hypothetical protein